MKYEKLICYLNENLKEEEEIKKKKRKEESEV